MNRFVDSKMNAAKIFVAKTIKHKSLNTFLEYPADAEAQKLLSS